MRQLAIGLVLFQAALCQPQAPVPDVQLEVRTLNNQRTFRIGEIIPLELRFTSTVENQYRLDTRNGDRSGRLNSETYTAEPRSGWQDPLDLFYRTGSSIGRAGEHMDAL